jgi:D-glycero-alpha-D-manno-heptose-7-phosphate kinase
MTISPERVQQLDDHLMLFYTGIKRTASDVAQSFLEDLDKRRRQLRIMKDLVEESISILNSQQDICAFGELLHEAWDTKRTLSDMVSNTEVDTMYAKARDAGAVGGKLLGAGGGGFLMLFVPPAKQEDVREVLDDLIHVPFTFEFSGSQVIFFDPEQDFSAAEEDRMQRSPQSFRELIPGTSFS